MVSRGVFAEDALRICASDAGTAKAYAASACACGIAHASHTPVKINGRAAKPVSAACDSAKAGGGTWFAVFVHPGRESEAASLLQAAVGRLGAASLFVPMAEIPVRNGNSACGRAPFIPGLVIVGAASLRDARALLRRARGIDVLLTSHPSLAEVLPAERVLIESFMGSDHVVSASEGFALPGGRFHVSSGPLSGREALVARVDHRRKVAWLRLSVAGHSPEARVGLRLVRARGTVNERAVVQSTGSTRVLTANAETGSRIAANVTPSCRVATATTGTTGSCVHAIASAVSREGALA